MCLYSSILSNIYFFIYRYNLQIYGTFNLIVFKALSTYVIIKSNDKKERGVKMKKLKQEYLDKIDEIVAKHKDEKGPMKLMLHEIQNELGYIPFEAMEKISETIGVPVSKVYGVVTFYSQFTTEPKGKHVIAVCLGTACYVNGSQTILDLLCEMTGCEVNSTSPDGLFSIDATRCVGACGLAPVVSVDGIVFGCTKQLEDLKMLVLDYLKEEAPC